MKDMTLTEWKEQLNPREIEALEDFEFKPNDLISPDVVLDTVVQWNGGISSAYHIKMLISRIYGIEL